MNLLFVCLGNICRSPLAEGLFCKMTSEEKYQHFVIESAGTSAQHAGELPHRGVLELGRQLGISFDFKRARQVRLDDFQKFDLLIAMDRSNLKDLQALSPNGHQKLRLFLDFTGLPGRDVHDPYFDGDFQKTYVQVEAGCRALLAHLARR